MKNLSELSAMHCDICDPAMSRMGSVVKVIVRCKVPAVVSA